MSTLRNAETAAQCAMILDALRSGRSLTPHDALREYKCFRLAARVYDLRKEGHNIVTMWERGANKRWARYVLLATRC